MRCVHCGRSNGKTGAPGFREVCEGCGNYLHSCVQCRLYDESRRCLSNTTEPVRDIEHANYCEEFQPLPSEGRTGDAKESPDSKKKFDDLFGG